MGPPSHADNTSIDAYGSMGTGVALLGVPIDFQLKLQCFISPFTILGQKPLAKTILNPNPIHGRIV